MGDTLPPPRGSGKRSRATPAPPGAIGVRWSTLRRRVEVTQRPGRDGQWPDAGASGDDRSHTAATGGTGARPQREVRGVGERAARPATRRRDEELA